MKTLCALLVCLPGLAMSAENARLVVHEWGTFTSLQDEAGKTISGINSDDEPVPKFCHDLNSLLVAKPNARPPILFQGAPRAHPCVTMRLETPVLYFHPPAGSGPLTLDVKVNWRGGWLTQFFPDARSEAPGAFKDLTGDTVGSLTWSQLKLGGKAPGPETSDRVWTAPRAVRAATVTSTNGESEKFLFYRGVGHLNAPLRVSRNAGDFHFHDQLDPGFKGTLDLQKLWLAEFRPNGTCAFRTLAPVTLEHEPAAIRLRTPTAFAEEAFSAISLTRLRAAMRAALMEDGLYIDEADALLNTWELSYFKSPGVRVFLLVPRSWTDHYLPLEISVPCNTARVMVGRLELVTPAHRALLTKLAEAPVPRGPWASIVPRAGLPGSDGKMPPAYEQLGRFRNALLLEEEKLRPTESLRAFIRLNGLEAYQY